MGVLMPIFRDTTFTDSTPVNGGRQIVMQFADDASRIERPVLVDWGAIQQAKADFLGYAELRAVDVGKYISRVTPHGFEGQLLNGKPWLWAQSISRVEALSPQGQRPAGDPDFNRALMQLVYTSRRHGVYEDHVAEMTGTATDPHNGGTVANPLAGLPDEATLSRFVTKLYKPTARSVTVPQAILNWVPQGAEPAGKILEGLGKREPGLDLTYIHHLRPEVPFTAIGTTMGKVNGGTFDGFPAQTLLCMEPEIEPKVSPLGTTVYDIHFHFRYLPKFDLGGTARGHNWFLRAWEQVVAMVKTAFIDYRRVNTKADGSGTDVFGTANFKNLFRPDQ